MDEALLNSSASTSKKRPAGPPSASASASSTCCPVQITQSPSWKKKKPIEWVDGYNYSYCEERCRDGCCRCHSASLSQRCQSCNGQIRPRDCIQKQRGGGAGGWVHVRCCPDENDIRGISAIRKDINPVLLLTDDDDDDGRCRRRLLTSDGMADSKPSGGGDNVLSVKDATDDDDGTSFLTQEQRDILDYKASPGSLIAVNALAGCGKTTTIALLCNRILQQQQQQQKTNNDPCSILYLVFSKKAQEEARQSKKFPKHGMTILTSHAYVRKVFFGDSRFNDCIPVSEYNLEEIVDSLHLFSVVRDTFPELSTDTKRRKRANTIARYVRETVENFQSSVSRRIEQEHVSWLARKRGASQRTQWRDAIRLGRYVSWAQQIFDEMQGRCEYSRRREHGGGRHYQYKIPHDAYIKVAQLTGMFHPFDVIALDEAQDMTACQADLFWSKRSRGDRVVYLFGDQWQQLFRFRGASCSFQDSASDCTKKMSLTGSFRFGSAIANIANHVLGKVEGPTLSGLAQVTGELEDASAFKKGVVICRTNNGMLTYLLHNKPGRWTFLEKNKKLPQVDSQMVNLEKFLWGDINAFKHEGELFRDIAELCGYCEDTNDMNLLKNLNLLESLQASDKHVQDFYLEIGETYVPLEGSAAEFDGVILTTCHGAKGLEFENVCLHSDFRFSELVKVSSFLNKPMLVDELNLIYVAVTRAKKKLFLPEEAREFFEFFAAEKEKRPRQFISSTSLRARRSHSDEVWKAFEDSQAPISTIDDIPWPKGLTPENLFSLDRNMNEQEQKEYIHLMLRRFHTDKFLPMHCERLKDASDTQKQLIKERLNSVFCQAMDIFKILRGENET